MTDRDRHRFYYDPERYEYEDEAPYREHRHHGSRNWEYQRARFRDERDFAPRSYAGPGYYERSYDYNRSADERDMPGPFGWYGDRNVNRDLGAQHHQQYERDHQQYERERERPHRESFGHQLREAGHSLARKVKRVFRGPKGYKRSDERIREDVNDRLSQQDHFDPSDIEVSVSNAEVTLTGFVRTRHEKFLAEEISDDVSGVTEVHNQLRVRREQIAPGIGENQQTFGQNVSGGSEGLRGRNSRVQY